MANVEKYWKNKRTRRIINKVTFSVHLPRLSANDMPYHHVARNKEKGHISSCLHISFRSVHTHLLSKRPIFSFKESMRCIVYSTDGLFYFVFAKDIPIREYIYVWLIISPHLSQNYNVFVN